MKGLNFTQYGRRGVLMCLTLVAVFTTMKFFAALGDPAYAELMKWTILGFFGAKGMEHLPNIGKKKKG